MGLDVDTGTMGGVYTTVEGVIEQLYKNLKDSNPFGTGDSAEGTKFREFLERLHGVSFFRFNRGIIAEEEAELHDRAGRPGVQLVHLQQSLPQP